jgi:hypothetical protein
MRRASFKKHICQTFGLRSSVERFFGHLEGQGVFTTIPKNAFYATSQVFEAIHALLHKLWVTHMKVYPHRIVI